MDAEKFGASDASVASGESNSLGAVSMFRDIDLPEAFHESAYHGWSGLEQLERWFSPARISRYRQALVRTAVRIDPEAAAWISTHSRVAGLLLERPLE